MCAKQRLQLIWNTRWDITSSTMQQMRSTNIPLLGFYYRQEVSQWEYGSQVRVAEARLGRKLRISVLCRVRWRGITWTGGQRHTAQSVLDTWVGEHRDKWAPATGLPSPVLAQSECEVLFCYHTPALWTPAAWQQVNVKSSLKMWLIKLARIPSHFNYRTDEESASLWKSIPGLEVIKSHVSR